MTRSDPARLAATTLLLAALGAAVALSGAREPGAGGRGAPDRERSADDFQRAVGGIGLGVALRIGPCAAAFDPRLESACALRLEPLPGGACFCRAHSALALPAGSPR